MLCVRASRLSRAERRPVCFLPQGPARTHLKSEVWEKCCFMSVARTMVIICLRMASLTCGGMRMVDRLDLLGAAQKAP